MTVEIKVLRCGDDSILMNSAKDVFDNPIDPELTREFLEDPRFAPLFGPLTGRFVAPYID
jgi:hypothetical protein